jgi:tellurite resistance protein
MSIRPPGRIEDLPADHLLGALYLVLIVAYADEEFADEEREMLRTQAKSLCQSKEEEEKLASFIDALPAHAESDDWVESAVETIRVTLPEPEARRDAFAMALEMARADGKIEMRETHALLEIVDRLGIDPEFAKAGLRRVKATPRDKLPDLDKTPWQSSPPENSKG